MTVKPKLDPAEQEPGYFTGYRWTCPTCSRFIALASLRLAGYMTPDGPETWEEATGGKCGDIEPSYRPTRWVATP